MSKKIVVVTALIGAYDSQLLDFEYDRDKYEFVCYTNMKRLKSNTWEMRYVDKLEVPNDNAKSSYYYKWNPHKYLDKKKYDTMIWMDSSFTSINMNVLDDFVKAFELGGKSLFIEKHPGRNTLQSELDANVRLNKDETYIMVNQVQRYFAEGYTETKTVMVETGLSFRKFKDPALIQFSEAIWKEISPEGNTKRDQLVYDYCLWKTSFVDYALFSFDDKMKLLRFTDHPNRSKHKEKVLMVGPWFGEDKFESVWVKYVNEYVASHPVDKIIVGCRPDREYLYENISPDRFIVSDPEGVKSGNLLNSHPPRFNVKSNDDKEVISLCSSDKEFIHRERKIHILWSTIRPETFNEVYKYWMDNCSDTSKIVPHVLVDTEDDKLKITEVPQESIIVEKPRFKGVAYPSYVLSSSLKSKIVADDDIVIFASDDFFPMNNWDEALYSEFTVFDGSLVVNDKCGEQNKNIVTIPMLSYSALKQLNHVIYHPVYNHCWSDNEFHDVCIQLGILKDISTSNPDVYFEHRHYANGLRVQDDSDKNNSVTNHTGHNIWKIRKPLSVSEKLKVDLDTKLLSILILTVPGREEKLEKLLSILNPQVTKDVEIVIEFDERVLSVGEKRNRALDRAQGRYICFVDDDDMVSPNYVKHILWIIGNTDVDCCALTGEITLNGGMPQKFIHSLKYKTWYEEGEGRDKIYYRNPNHLNVVKREIARRVRFIDISTGEDADYSKRLLKHLTVQGEIDPTLYYYDAVIGKDM